ncbi:Protein kinase C signaling pathway involved MAPKK protein [Lodderomyces elongisporus]|uniref:Protein kinase C signaling pathway involved MAPKK protein n=1 Tax=Lodderomyces elongisporus TaxID=36914 RepID=UPI00292495E0|nr:Protein kinase C signaling pathway involved MAPKK protein [Lodderomyces elongisporus]WLF77265.1 Protein kinase C signaling pathway involved MAPKK protein [Lodderomyces elongisporus]
MSGIPLFNVPNTKRAFNSPALPSLSIPESHNNTKPPRLSLNTNNTKTNSDCYKSINNNLNNLNNNLNNNNNDAFESHFAQALNLNQVEHRDDFTAPKNVDNQTTFPAVPPQRPQIVNVNSTSSSSSMSSTTPVTAQSIASSSSSTKLKRKPPPRSTTDHSQQIGNEGHDGKLKAKEQRNKEEEAEDREEEEEEEEEKDDDNDDDDDMKDEENCEKGQKGEDTAVRSKEQEVEISGNNTLETRPNYENIDNRARNPSPIANNIRKYMYLEDIKPYEWHYLANNNQIKKVGSLGEGNGGAVTKCYISQMPTRPLFALKLIITDPEPQIQKQIFRELEIARKYQHQNIVKYYGTFLQEKQSMIGITMEYMDGKSLDAIYKEVLKRDPTNRINEKVLGKIANSILNGLDYLHSKNIIHRDIKPSNVLLDTKGAVKLCDFGVSGEAVNSLASTFVGTQYYMAPERIMGKDYSISSDIWSLGMSMLEVANGKFPIDLSLGPIEVVEMVSRSELLLKDSEIDNIHWTFEFKRFISRCLIKDSKRRPIPREMLAHDEWCVSQSKEKVKMDKFVKVVWKLNE